jgi:Fic family protein
MSTYIHQHYNWPDFIWEYTQTTSLLGKIRNLQGRLVGKMETLGFDLQNEAYLKTVTLDVLKSSEIEGELFDMQEVRSSVARHLNMDIYGLVPSDRNVDGIVEVLLDATIRNKELLTKERLCEWHKALFPDGKSGGFEITIGDYRKDDKGPMQVVSGALGFERVHFEAPHADRLENEMTLFLDWFNGEQDIDLVEKAAVAHLWFITLHPFDDGNGRIARALTDLLLSQSDESNQRFYSMSAQIRLDRKNYYYQLEKAQKGDLDITNWMVWFFTCLQKSLVETQNTLFQVIQKANFWNKHKGVALSERQSKMLNKLLDDFEGKLTSTKWGKMMKCSPDSALRDIQDLIQKGLLEKEDGGGRSTNYRLNFEL